MCPDPSKPLPSSAVAEASMGPEMRAEFVKEMTRVHEIFLEAKAEKLGPKKWHLVRDGLDALRTVMHKFGPHMPPNRNLRN